MSRIEISNISLPRSGEMTVWSGLPGASRCMAIACACNTTSNNMLIVCINNQEAEQVAKEISFFIDSSDKEVVYIPDTETLPYDIESPPAGIVSSRASAFHKLANTSSQVIVVTSVSNILARMSNKSHWLENFSEFKIGSIINKDEATRSLESIGYNACDLEVSVPGDFVFRNKVFDIFPVGADGAYRIRLNDDWSINGIFSLNLSTQLSSSTSLEGFIALPCREMPINASALKLFASNYRREFGVGIGEPIFDSVRGGVLPAGIESLSPLFQESTLTLFDYLPSGSETQVFVMGSMAHAIESYWAQIKSRYDDLLSDKDRRILSPERLWMTLEDFSNCLSRHPLVVLTETSIDIAQVDCKGKETNLKRQKKLTDTIALIEPFISNAKHVVFCLHSDARRSQIENICRLIGYEPVRADSWTDCILDKDAPKASIINAEINNGFFLPDQGLLFISEKDIFGQVIFRKNNDEAQKGSDYQEIQDLQNLKIGDPVVHLKYGVGRYAGLKLTDFDGIEREHLTISYAEDATIFVRMEDLYMVSRYGGLNVDKAPLDIVGSEKWLKGLNGAKNNIRKLAHSLLEIKAKREIRPGIKFNKPDFNYARFCSEFPFQETYDQRAAVDDIINDMTSDRAMERLVCGDVGFGKTEVFLKAAFLACNSGYQVAIMVPTSLLANQHFESIKKRFASFDTKIECLTRLDKKEEARVLRGLNDGTIDIVVGTHRLIQGDVKFKNLGLLVIDEEHRFGVNHKEKLKIMRAEVDTLSLTATPIPRTMSMAMHGIRDMSIISTAPAKRLSIRTLVRDFDDKVIAESIQRELMRDGQVFFLHNRIETIEERAEYLRQLVPGLRVKCVHGKMEESQIDEVMGQFHNYEFDVLVATTIIETGIDVPRSNTILIENANNFGLAQLHQLRGRVGRSTRQGYAYLLLSKSDVSETGAKRLRAMEQASSLGEGFVLANHDLEIRGAGEILGEEQSGHIQAIGFALYLRLLERAIDALKNNEDISDVFEQEDQMHLDIQMSGLLDSHYIENPHARLSVYKRLVSSETMDEIASLQEEMRDRFGDIPENSMNLLNLSRLRSYLNRVGVKKLFANEKDGYLELRRRPRINPLKLREVAMRDRSKYEFNSPRSLRFVRDMPNDRARISFLLLLVIELSKPIDAAILNS